MTTMLPATMVFAINFQAFTVAGSIMETLAYLDPVLKILEIFAIIGSVWAAIIRVNSSGVITQETLKTQNGIIMELKADLKQSMGTIAGVLTQLATTNVRLDRIEADIHDMQHGKTFVTDPPGFVRKS